MVTEIGAIAVETGNIMIAARVAAMVSNSKRVRGSVRIAGTAYRWSTLQQYRRQREFTASRKYMAAHGRYR